MAAFVCAAFAFVGRTIGPEYRHRRFRTDRIFRDRFCYLYQLKWTLVFRRVPMRWHQPTENRFNECVLIKTALLVFIPSTGKVFSIKTNVISQEYKKATKSPYHFFAETVWIRIQIRGVSSTRVQKEALHRD